MAALTWPTRELPILEAVGEVEGLPAHRRRLTTRALAAKLDIPMAEVARGIRALMRSGHIRQTSSVGSADDFVLIAPMLGERGRRAIGQWPSGNAYADLIKLIETRIDQTTDDETRSQVERLLDTLTGIGEKVATSVLTQWLKDVLGIP